MDFLHKGGNSRQIILDALGEASPAIAKTLATRAEKWKQGS